MALVLDTQRLEDRNYVVGFFELLGKFVQDCSEVLSTIELSTRAPFVPSIGRFSTVVSKNLRIHSKALYHTETGSPYKFMVQIVSYDRDSGSLEFEVLAVDYEGALSPAKAEETSVTGGTYVAKLLPSGGVTISSNAYTAPLQVVNGGTGSTDTSEFLDISFSSFLENHRISTKYIYEDFLTVPQVLSGWKNSVGSAPRNSGSGAPIEIVGDYRTYVGSSVKTSPPSTLGGSTMGRRAGFLEILAGGSSPSSSAVYLGRSYIPPDADNAEGTLGTFSNSSSNPNNIDISVDFLIPALSTAGERYILEVGLVSSFGASQAGLWASYTDNENSGRPVLKSRDTYFAGILTSNSAQALTADTWHSLRILASGTSFQISVGSHSVTRAISSTLSGYIMFKLTKTVGSGQVSAVLDFISYRRNTLSTGRRA